MSSGRGEKSVKKVLRTLSVKDKINIFEEYLRTRDTTINRPPKVAEAIDGFGSQGALNKYAATLKKQIGDSKAEELLQNAKNRYLSNGGKIVS